MAVYLTGCTSYKPVSHKPETGIEKPEQVNYDNKRSIGIDLFASGNEPFWIVDMDSEDSTKIYILSDNYNVNYKTPIPVLDSATKTINYTFDSNVILTLKKEKCKNNMSGEISEFTASLYIQNMTYNGCGKYIIAAMNPFLSQSTLRLNDMWALQKFRNQKINTSSFKEGIPILELHLNDGRFLGNTDCNTVSGSIDVGDSYISFTDFTSTKKLCEGNFEPQYLQDLKSVDSWTIDKMVLILKKNGKEVLVYNKID